MEVKKTRQAKLPGISNEEVMRLLHAVRFAVSSDFTGVGLVFYSPPLTLPIAALRTGEPLPFELPLHGPSLPEAVAELSKASSLWHDGFHLVDAGTLALTHVAQFISPPIAPFRGALPRRGGARHMTAALSSLVYGVSCTAILTADGRASVYRNGQCIVGESLS